MFLMSSILFGCIAVTIPVIIHLLHRQKITPVAWGAMQFLLETPLKQKRRQNIDHWLLMLVRMALLALLAILLARPLWRGSALSGTVNMDVAVVIDHSLSMGRRTGGGGEGGTLFEQGLDAVDKLAAMLPPSSTISVVLAEHSPRTITPLPVGLGDATGGGGKPAASAEWSKIRQQLRTIKPGLTDANIPDAILAARELVQRGGNLRKMVLVISDEQRSNWQIGNEGAWRLALGDRSDPRTAQELPIHGLPVSALGSGPNVAVSALNVTPDFLGVNRPVQVLATIANTGSSDMPGLPVQLIVDGRNVAQQQIANLPAGQSQTLRFDHFFIEPGAHWVKVRAEAVDALEADNSMVWAGTVWPQLRVLVIDGQLTAAASAGGFRSAQFLLAAMNPSEGAGLGGDAGTLVTPKVISVSDVANVALEDYPLVVLHDVPRMPVEQIARLADYVQRGNGLWIILGPRTQEAFVRDVLAKSPLLPVSAKPPVTEANGVGVDIREPQNPMVALVTASERNALAGVAVRNWWPVSPLGGEGGGGGGGGMRTILATTTGDPLVLELEIGRSGGRVVVWTTSTEGSWSNLPLAPNFVPLVNETLFHLAAGQAKAQSRQLEAGQTIVWSGPATPAVESIKLTQPDGQARVVPAQLRGDKYVFSYADTFVPGLYELRFTPREVPQPVFYSVAIDRAELDPAVLSAADAQWLRERNYLQERLTAETLPQALNAQATGTELWPLAAFLVLALLVLEVLMTRRLVRLQTGIQADQAGLVQPVHGPWSGGTR